MRLGRALKRTALAGAAALGLGAVFYGANYIQLSRYEKNAKQEIDELNRLCGEYIKAHKGEDIPFYSAIAVDPDTGEFVTRVNRYAYLCDFGQFEREKEIEFYEKAKLDPLLEPYWPLTERCLKERTEGKGHRTTEPKNRPIHKTRK